MTGRTNIGGKFFIAVDTSNDPDPQNDALNLAGFQALSYLEVPDMGSHGDTGITQNIVSYSTWGTRLAVKQKGEAQGQDAEVRFLDAASNGKSAMDSAADVTDNNNYAFKILWADGQVEYNRGVVTGPTLSKGANEDFAEAVYTLGLNQEPEFDTESD